MDVLEKGFLMALCMATDANIGIQYEDLAYTAALGFATVGANNVHLPEGYFRVYG